MNKKILIAFGALMAGLLIWTALSQPPADDADQVARLNADPLTPTVTITGQQVPYHGETTGFLARPEGPGPFPALILIHEWWGLNDNIRDFAKQFAKEGYIALAVDLYDGRYADTPEEARALATEVRGDLDGAFANLNDAVEFLRERPDVDAASLASVGWCFGGGWAYQMAVNDLGVASSVMYYGRFSPDDDLEMMKADILGHFGEEDASIAVDDVREFEARLKTAGGDHQVFIYPNAGHAFANADNEAAYDAEAAALAWRRTLDFLTRTLP
jgi:carboxymethylenebutenolidase